MLIDNIEERISLNGKSDFIFDILNLMCLLRTPPRQAFIYSNTIWKIITVSRQEMAVVPTRVKAIKMEKSKHIFISYLKVVSLVKNSYVRKMEW